MNEWKFSRTPNESEYLCKCSKKSCVNVLLFCELSHFSGVNNIRLVIVKRCNFSIRESKFIPKKFYEVDYMLLPL